jgi:hypothetical protein
VFTPKEAEVMPFFKGFISYKKHFLFYSASSFFTLTFFSGCDKILLPRPEPNFALSTSTHVQAGLSRQLLNLSNGVRVKLVLLQSRLVDENNAYFTPNIENYLFNYPGSQLIAFDTDEGYSRFLDSTLSSRGTPLITRDGRKVLWSDFARKTVFIINWDGTGKKALLQRNSNYVVVCVQWDDSADIEWVYIADLYYFGWQGMTRGSAIYRYPLNGTELDTTRKELVSDTLFYTPWTVSGDGKYAGGDMDWPNASIQTLPNGAFKVLGAGCHAQISPDTSYLFFFMLNDHSNLHLYQFTSFRQIVNLNLTMPGNNGQWDCICPRWTNSSRYLTCGYPYTTAYFSWYRAIPPPSNPKILPPGASGEFCFGKFNQDFTAIEWVLVTDLDNSFRKVVGDGWLADGEGPYKP